MAAVIQAADAGPENGRSVTAVLGHPHHREAGNSAALRFEFDRRFIRHLLRTLLLRVRPRPQAQLTPSWMRP